MSNKTDVESLIRKFVANSASEDECELLQEYFKTPIGLKYLEQIIDEHAADFDNVHLKQSSSERLESILPKENNRKPLISLSNRISTLAATFIGIAMLVTIFFYISNMQSLSVYKTEAGQKTTITLPDNTIVTLNGNSSLSYYDNWKEEKFRSVNLSGEAYFKVTSNAQKPFVVNTSDISIKVLGTTFNVKSYDEDEHVETTLVEGKVVIEKATEGDTALESVELSPDQKATFSKDSKQIMLEEVKWESEAAWIRGSLVFEDEPFSEIRKDLERLYGIKIFVKDKASLQCRFNTRLEGESLEEVLKLFSLSGNATYRIQDRQAWIEGSLCDQNAK
jgi:transmembrane sensor